MIAKNGKELTEAQVHKDNPHFGPAIRIIEEGQHSSKNFPQYTYAITVAAMGSESRFGEMDAWATYMWDCKKEYWLLTMN